MIEREHLRRALERAVARGGVDVEAARDILAAHDAGALDETTLPDDVVAALDAEGDEARTTAAVALVAWLLPIALASVPRPGRAGWRWSAERLRYETAGGVPLDPAFVRRAVDRVIAASNRTLPTPVLPPAVAPAPGPVPAAPAPAPAAASAPATPDPVALRRSLSAWQASTEEALLARHTAMAATARGGLARLTDDDRAWIRERVLSEAGHLEGFRGRIEAAALTGEPMSDAMIGANLELYNEAGRWTYEAMNVRVHVEAGFDEQRNVLDVMADHCQQCPEETARGWHLAGTGVPIGERDCMRRDRCHYVFRRRSRQQETA